MNIGPYSIDVPLALAPMAGLSDLPFRETCRAHGAGYAVGEMTASKPELRGTRKSATRWAERSEASPRAVQLLGADPAQMTDAARYAVDSGAQIVDINMGCPAKKVLSRECGSALMKDEALALAIVEAVANAVPVPVTVKMRTGWDRAHRNAPRLARLFEDAGAAMLAVHGRTREDGFRGEAEYETIRLVKESVKIPVLANGDIDSGEKALAVLRATGADGLMIGRAAVGNPWIFEEAAAAMGLRGGFRKPSAADRVRAAIAHARRHFVYYGGTRGAVTIRKHLAGYLKGLPGAPGVLSALFAERDPDRVTARLEEYCGELAASCVS